MPLGIRVAFALALVSAVAPAVLSAQTDTTRMAAPNSASMNATPSPSATRLALADTLLVVLHSEATVKAARKAQFDAIVKQQPQLAKVRDVFDAWADKYLTWADTRPLLAQLYARTFTDDDLRAVIAFYRTPAGQNLVAKQPEILQQAAAFGAELAAKHQPELQAMLLSRLAPASDTTR
jgi:hypothetical protein